MTMISLIISWIFLVLGFLIFTCSLVTLACQEGSCGFDKCCTDFCYILFCCCFFKSKAKSNQEDRTKKENGQQDQPRFSSNAFGILRLLGINLGQTNTNNLQQSNKQHVEEHKYPQIEIEAYQQPYLADPKYPLEEKKIHVARGIPIYEVPPPPAQEYPYIQGKTDEIKPEDNIENGGMFSIVKKKLKGAKDAIKNAIYKNRT